jgi:hypothetical protein
MRGKSLERVRCVGTDTSEGGGEEASIFAGGKASSKRPHIVLFTKEV